MGINLLRGKVMTTPSSSSRAAQSSPPNRSTDRCTSRCIPTRSDSTGINRKEARATCGSGRIDGTDLLGDRVRVHVAGPVPLVAEITAASLRALELHDGVEVFASVKATELTIYPV